MFRFRHNVIFSKATCLMMVLVFLFEMLVFPLPALASQENQSSKGLSEEKIFSQQNLYLEESPKEDLDLISTRLASINNQQISRLPVNNDLKILKEQWKIITAYTSEVAQCDSSPCITANGFNVCDHGTEDTIADNTLDFGTKVKIPELFGDRIFVVRDRMNPRYVNRIDVWMKSKNRALEFGVKKAKIQIVE